MSHKEVQYDENGVPHKVDVPDQDETPSPPPAPKPAPPKSAPPKPPKPLPGGDKNVCGTAQECADKMSSNQSTDNMNGYG